MTRVKVSAIVTTIVLPVILTSIVGNPGSIFAQGTPVTPVTPIGTTPTPTQPVTPVNPTATPIPTIPVTAPVVTSTPTPTNTPNPTPTQTPTVTVTPTPQPDKSRISVYAAGTKALKRYPTLKLWVNNEQVKVWKHVKGDPNKGKFEELKTSYKNSLNPGDKIKVEFTNDFAFWKLGDRNVRIDKIEVNGTIYQTENPSVYGTGAATQSYSCGAGNLQTEWLYCNGYFEYTL